MNTIKRTILGGLSVAGLVGLLSCTSGPKTQDTQSYFASIPMLTEGLAMASGDFNNDGHPDLIVAARAPDVRDDEGRLYISWHRNGQLSKPEYVGAVPMLTKGLAMTSGDFNKDGHLDLIVAARAPNERHEEGRLYMLRNVNGKFSGAGYFASVPMLLGGLGVAAADYDGDGDLDLIVGARARNVRHAEARLYHFKNDGNGGFSQN